MENTDKRTSGGISVTTENIFPIIKKWLYSDKDIFLRELVSNACDAITKLKRLSSMGEYEISDDSAFKVTVSLDEELKTLTVSDNGIGMTKDEVEKYICNIALSGAVDFIEKYESEDASSIIGHFGLGFYSAFMVADTVEIFTRSYTGEKTVHWSCNDAGAYSIGSSDEEREEVGTDVVLHINADSEEFLKKYRTEGILSKYCSFMQVPIYVTDDAESLGESISDPSPLWMKNPSDCTEEEYKDFYKKVFDDVRDPLFWVHIKADYPLNFKGIFYFPPIRSDYDSLEGQVKLYYNQVFVADNIKEVVPEYLLLLRGILDCPELPLNVSRSYLQNSGYVSKISAHITKKVADKLVSLSVNSPEEYEKFWDDIKIFAEYGCIKDKKFYDRVKDALLLTLSDDSHTKLSELCEKAKSEWDGKIYYSSDKTLSAQYVSLFEKKGYKIVFFSGMLDIQFMSFIEGEMDVKFMRVDSDFDALTDKDGKEEYENTSLEELFKSVSGLPSLSVKFAPLSSEEVPAILNVSEEMRRFSDMMKMYNGGTDMGGFSAETALILNSENSLIRKLGEISENEEAKTVARYIFMLALLAQRPLSSEELSEFLTLSYKMAEKTL